MSLQKLYDNFGIEPDIKTEKDRFVQRINQSVFYLIKQSQYPDSYQDIFITTCYSLGINGRIIISDENQINYGSLWIPDFSFITKNDFMETIKVLSLLYESVSVENKKMVSGGVELALCQAVTDIGIRWKDGMFYPSGAKELDEKLVNDNLDWLVKYPDVKDMFSRALTHFNSSLSNPESRKDAITNAYSSIEALTRIILKNDKSFDKNSNDLVELLELPTEYKNIVHYYKQIANEYSSRHAGSEFEHSETEAFIYFTGILIRLILTKLSI